MNRLIPYPTLAGEISLEVREVRLDGAPLNLNMISSSRHVVALHEVERERWDEARLSVRLHPPRHELDDAAWSDVNCVAVLAERRTNARSVTPLEKEPDGTWTGVVVMHGDHHLGQAQLSGHVIATVDGVVGRTIGVTDRAWTVDLQARTPARQQSIKVLTVDFGDAEHPHLHSYKDDPWTVEAVGEEPLVYLNSRFEGLVPLLTDGDRGARDLLAAQIAADAWTALFNAAVYAADMEDGQPLWPGGWHGAVLKRMLPDVFPDLSPDDALIEAVTRRLNGDGGDLQTRLGHAAGRQALISRRLGGFIRATNRKEHS
ncbi:hypothetical protein AB0K34_08160 [Actinomadura sp. NPDC049382]|uniref:hypothetical protein n=1 Tax=Actinomadura sp. NPDC049382 TaxID=3158220 RepID=UPI003427BE79